MSVVSFSSEVKREERLLKAKMFEKKLTAVRVRKHYGDYCVRMKSRMVNKSAREEQIFIKQFEKGEQLSQFIEYIWRCGRNP